MAELVRVTSKGRQPYPRCRPRASDGGRLLARHRDAHRFLGRDEVVRARRGLGDGDLHALHLSGEGVATRTVIFGHGRARVLAHVAAIVGGEDRWRGGWDRALAHLLAVDVKGYRAAFAQAAAGVRELH